VFERESVRESVKGGGSVGGGAWGKLVCAYRERERYQTRTYAHGRMGVYVWMCVYLCVTLLDVCVSVCVAVCCSVL